MSPRLHALSVLALALFLLAEPPSVSARPDEPYEETAKEHSWLSFSRPHETTPAAQLAYASRLRDEGRLRSAGRHFRALAVTWPGSPEAPVAQLAYAKTLDDRGNTAEAFDEYQELMENYPGQFAYEEVMHRQFAIATAEGERRRLAWFGLPGFAAPERAIPFLEKILQNGPQWEKAAQAQLLIGQAYEESSQEDLAVAAYLLCEERYPGTDQAREAALGRARCWYALSKDSPNDEATLEEAYAATTSLLRAHPDLPEAEELRTRQALLIRRREDKAFERARFYERVARRPAAALHSYESFVRLFPSSARVAEANERIRVLSAQTQTESTDAPST